MGYTLSVGQQLAGPDERRGEGSVCNDQLLMTPASLKVYVPDPSGLPHSAVSRKGKVSW